jgi:hypothetical protein
LSALSRGVNTVAVKAIKTATKQLGRHQIVKTSYDNSNTQIRRIGKTSLKDGHQGSAMELTHRATAWC